VNSKIIKEIIKYINIKIKKQYMFLKKVGIWIVASCISFCLFTLIFITAIKIDPENIIKDIYTHSNDATKQKIQSFLTNTCLQTDENQAMADEAKQKDYPIDPKIIKINQLCTEFKQKQISDDELFAKAVHIYIEEVSSENFQDDVQNKATKQAGLPDQGELQNILNIESQIKKIIIPFLTLLIIFLFVLLYLFYLKNPIDYMKRSGQIFVKIAVIMLVPWLILQIYLMVHPLDTTPIINGFLSNIDQSNNTITPQSNIEPIVLLVLKTIYNTRVAIISLIALFFGILLRWIFPKYLSKKMLMS